MNTSTSSTRLNITVPDTFVERLRRFVPNRKISAFLVEAGEEKLRKEQRDQALKAILAGPPSFTDIEDSTAYVRSLRDIDRQREKRLGLL